MLIRRSAAVLTGLTLSSTLVACTGDDDTAAGSPSEDAVVLPLGTATDVDFYPADGGTDPVGSGTVAVTAVREGAISDLRDAGYTLDADQASSTPYYVDVRFENTGSRAVEPRTPGGVDDTGDTILALTLIDLSGSGFEPCPGVPDTLRPGAGAADGCAIVLVPPGRSLERVYYLASAGVADIYWKAS